jgi:hypothetical protein
MTDLAATLRATTGGMTVMEIAEFRAPSRQGSFRLPEAAVFGYMTNPLGINHRRQTAD